MQSLSVLIPAYNEEVLIQKTVLSMLDYLKSLRIDFEVIVCVNDSTDKTEKIVKSLSKWHKQIRYVFVKEKGFGIAIRRGIKEAKKKLITYMPADGEIKNNFIGNAIKQFPKYDIVLGSRYLSKKYFKNGFHRIFLSLMLALIVRIVFSNKVTEMGTVKMFKASWAKKILSEVKSDNFDLQIEILYLALKDLLKIKEIPVDTFNRRTQAESKVNLIKDPYNLLIACLKYGYKLKKHRLNNL